MAYFLLLFKSIFSTSTERYFFTCCWKPYFYCDWKSYFQLLWKSIFSSFEMYISDCLWKAHFLLVLKGIFSTAPERTICYCCLIMLNGIFPTAVISIFSTSIEKHMFYSYWKVYIPQPFKAIFSTAPERQIIFCFCNCWNAYFCRNWKAYFLLLLLKGIFATTFERHISTTT